MVLCEGLLHVVLALLSALVYIRCIRPLRTASMTQKTTRYKMTKASTVNRFEFGRECDYCNKKLY